MVTKRRAVTVGSAVVDIIAVVANKDIERLMLQNTAASFLLLEPGRKIEADSISIHTGGGAINTGVALARLGHATSPLVKIGRDLKTVHARRKRLGIVAFRKNGNNRP